MDIKTQSSIVDFFHDMLTEAIRNQGIDTSTPTECYLVNLLAAFTKTPVNDEPLGIKLAKVISASPEERLQTLRDVGDTSLYVSGFFSESLQRKLIDIDYYIQLGGSAYGQLARHFHGRSSDFETVYGELGANFTRYVDVLSEVSESSSMTSNTGVVQLYERWLRTGSDWIERRLRQKGVIPKKGDLQ
jgi:hypothetical protein